MTSMTLPVLKNTLVRTIQEMSPAMKKWRFTGKVARIIGPVVDVKCINKEGAISLPKINNALSH